MRWKVTSLILFSELVTRKALYNWVSYTLDKLSFFATGCNTPRTEVWFSWTGFLTHSKMKCGFHRLGILHTQKLIVVFLDWVSYTLKNEV